ncbi:bleomycin resistance protein [Paenibacillus oryzae]|uniref:Bleomycin resistance protein n=1 Tax=Paenibacillus oryzae TaxID=1844972 RepID=A0A1A5YCW5_9BACL|nr:glyoxalase superfamily protein [Paenibacillus oryzae]OBR63422.1 bleomycin resistance protein [Paenibacillus oryzae]
MEMEQYKAQAPIPILRIFDIDAAKAFYVDFLEFKVDWEHQFEEGYPLYLQISAGACILHLSEHHGDCTPGAALRIGVQGIRELQQRLLNKNYKYAKPGLEEMPWGMLELRVGDPFGNRLIFFEESGIE